jgi:hypothetical protein
VIASDSAHLSPQCADHILKLPRAPTTPNRFRPATKRGSTVAATAKLHAVHKEEEGLASRISTTAAVTYVSVADGYGESPSIGSCLHCSVVGEHPAFFPTTSAFPHEERSSFEHLDSTISTFMLLVHLQEPDSNGSHSNYIETRQGMVKKVTVMLRNVFCAYTPSVP